MNPTLPPAASAFSSLVVVRAEPSGQYTAQAVGIPEIRVTAATREEAIQQVRATLGEWLRSGQLVSVDLPRQSSWPMLPRRVDPNDPLEQEYLEELARAKREDLERTLREY